MLRSVWLHYLYIMIYVGPTEDKLHDPKFSILWPHLKQLDTLTIVCVERWSILTFIFDFKQQNFETWRVSHCLIRNILCSTYIIVQARYSSRPPCAVLLSLSSFTGATNIFMSLILNQFDYFTMHSSYKQNSAAESAF